MTKIQLSKSRESNPDYFVIEGIASTADLDTFDEVINQNGIDLSLVDEGAIHLNLEHGDDFPLYELSVVGTVTDAKITDDGLFIKARVYWAHPHASKIYAEIEKSPESVQLSVEMGDCEYGEGKFSNIVLSGTLIGVALTKNPANDSTYTQLSKSIKDPDILKLAKEICEINKTIRRITRFKSKRKIVVITGK